MDIGIIKDAISGTDIYILDQILKNRYQTGDSILDAGCGNGRNLKWFYQSKY
jgi:SAM-dependent methyltransferase